MTELVIRIDDAVMARLQRRAQEDGRSLEDQIHDILRRAVEQKPLPRGRLGSEIAALFTRVGLESDIPELRGCTVKHLSRD